MNNALIGYTGFVGGTLLDNADFVASADLYRSTNIGEIRGKRYALLVCAGAPAKKWYANAHPEEDRQAIDGLINHLDTVTAERVVLVSTVDVFPSPVRVDENTPIDGNTLQPYGYNRRRLEEFVQEKFNHALIVRLPGLVGHGLKKNIIFDFLNNNNLDQIESRNVFQFYPMDRLWTDIQLALSHDLPLVHLTAEPVDVRTVAHVAFNLDFQSELDKPLVNYDMRSIHAGLWSKQDYQYSRDESLAAIRRYAQTEARTL